MKIGSFEQGAGGAPLDRRYLNRAYQNGVQLANAALAGQAQVITSTGAVGTYTITFAPVVFAVAPTVVAWCSKESGGNAVLLNLDAVTALLFQFDMYVANAGLPITVNHTVTVEWIAFGS